MEDSAAIGTKKLDVLVVDDDEAGLCDLTASLTRAGLTCAGANTGWKALETLAAGSIPSVVVTDISMPELDGIELAHRLTRMDVPKLPEIVFISGHAALGHAVDAIRLRARDLLTKPIDLRRLIQIVKEVKLERHSFLTPARAPSQPRAQKSLETRGLKAIDVESMSVGILKSLRNLQRIRRENLPAGLAVEASWEILLDLYVSELDKKCMSLTAVGGSAGVALTSALRRIHELESKGMISRVSDEKDKRRAAAQLTEMGREAVESFVRAYVGSCRDDGASHDVS
jgi:CheY-like chemotaxis protein